MDKHSPTLAQPADAAAAPVLDALAAVDQVLRTYAERGVVQDYRMAKGKNGSAQFDFGWLYGQPFTLSCDVGRRRLTLNDLLPGIDSDSMMYRELKAFLKERAAADLPEHRRVDPLLATAAPRLRDGVMSLELTLAGQDYEYGTRKLINLAHELFLFLNETWADYMWQTFQLNME
jgi:hypothetical protein